MVQITALCTLTINDCIQDFIEYFAEINAKEVMYWLGLNLIQNI